MGVNNLPKVVYSTARRPGIELATTESQSDALTTIESPFMKMHSKNERLPAKIQKKRILN